VLSVALACASRITLQISGRDSSRSSSCRIRFIPLESFRRLRIRNSAWRCAPRHELPHLLAAERAVLAIVFGDRVMLPAPDRRGLALPSPVTPAG
jgi:hypothetical protein